MNGNKVFYMIWIFPWRPFLSDRNDSLDRHPFHTSKTLLNGFVYSWIGDVRSIFCDCIHVFNLLMNFYTWNMVNNFVFELYKFIGMSGFSIWKHFLFYFHSETNIWTQCRLYVNEIRGKTYCRHQISMESLLRWKKW